MGKHNIKMYNSDTIYVEEIYKCITAHAMSMYWKLKKKTGSEHVPHTPLQQWWMSGVPIAGIVKSEELNLKGGMANKRQSTDVLITAI